MENTHPNQQETLPKSTTVLVLGILSIFPGVACVGIVGVVLGIITLITSKNLVYRENIEVTELFIREIN